MKQYINSKQLKELIPDQFRNLCKLVGDKYHYDHTDEQINKHFQKEYLTMYISILERTNIGRMIEILDKDYVLEMTTSEIKIWLRGDIRTSKSYKKELCDSLWEAVKLIL